MQKYNVNFDIEFRSNPFKGTFVAIEGIDGSGKTTQAQKVTDELKKQGYKVIYTKEPTDEPTGKFIRQVLSGEITIPSVSLQYMFGADRGVHLEIIEKLLKNEYVVITDRYFWSSVAYGVFDMGEISDFYLTAFSLLSFYHRFMVPDVSIFLDVKPEVAISRIRQSTKHKDIYDRAEKLPIIKESYDFLLNKFGDKFTTVDGDRDMEEITKEIIQIIRGKVFK